MNRILMRTPVIGKDGLMTKEWITQQSLTAQAASGSLQAANNLSDVANAATARLNLGLGTAATAPSGEFLVATNNLEDLPNKVSARLNLGLGTAATAASSAFDAAGLAGAAQAASLQKAANLSDIANPAVACANLGLGAGVSGTIAIPKIATSTGSITFVNGIVTAFVNPT